MDYWALRWAIIQLLQHPISLGVWEGIPNLAVWVGLGAGQPAMVAAGTLW